MSFGELFNGYLQVFTKYRWMLTLHVHRLDTGIIGPVSDMEFFRRDIAMTSPILRGLIMSSVLLPSAIVSNFAGSLVDAVGRPRAITFGFCIFAFGAAVQAGSIHITMFIGGRIIVGTGIGPSLSTVVVCTCEPAPPAKRGALATVSQLFSATGIMTGYFICYGTIHINSSMSWRLPLALLSLLAFLFAAVCAPLPQSPRWLTLCGLHENLQSLWVRLGVRPAGEGAAIRDGVKIEKHGDAKSKTDCQSSDPPAIVAQRPAHTQHRDSTAVVSHSIF